MPTKIPVIGFAARSGTGKTTLIEKIIPLLRAQNIRLTVIKHSHHNVSFDQPGKDSYRFRQAGAFQVLLATPNQWLLSSERKQTGEPSLQNAIDQINKRDCDLIIVEGFRDEPFSKIEIIRSAMHHPPLYLADKTIMAIASDSELNNPPIPVLPLNDAQAIADFIGLNKERFDKI